MLFAEFKASIRSRPPWLCPLGTPQREPFLSWAAIDVVHTEERLSGPGHVIIGNLVRARLHLGADQHRPFGDGAAIRRSYSALLTSLMRGSAASVRLR